MRFVEVITLLGFNVLVVLVMQHFHSRSLELRLKRVSQEVRELENLVAAIIEEFEEVAGMKETTQPEPAKIEPPVNAQDPETLELPIIEPESETFEPSVTFSVQPQAEVAPLRVEANTKPADARHQRILTLSSQGMDVADIAREMGIGRGEVSLILGLYKRS